MTETKLGGFSWGFPLYGALGAFILAFPTLIYGNGIGAFLGTAALAALIGFVIVVVAILKVRRHNGAVLAMVCIFVVLAYVFFKSSNDLRTTARWLVYSRSYKEQVMDQPTLPDGTLKHIEWDGWGFAGAGDTTVYLVMDPSDMLADAAKGPAPIKFKGIPCPVVSIHRVERYWYTVLFYTDTAWNDCG